MPIVPDSRNHGSCGWETVEPAHSLALFPCAKEVIDQSQLALPQRANNGVFARL
jgi:hypothetical protein